MVIVQANINKQGGKVESALQAPITVLSPRHGLPALPAL